MTTTMDPPSAQEQPTRKGQLSNLAQRMLTGLLLLPLILFTLFVGGWPMALLTGALVWIAVLEFYRMSQGERVRGLAPMGVPMALAVLAAYHYQEALIWQIALPALLIITLGAALIQQRAWHKALSVTALTSFPILYVAFPAAFLLAIRASQPAGIVWIIAVMFATWGADTMAYLVGRALGKTPLAPRLSPKKTLEGAIGGVVGGVFFPMLVLLQADLLTLETFILLLMAPFFAIGGDLFESALKRHFEVKDSAVPGLNPFPGHGGVLDRIDALLWVSALFYIFLLLQGAVWY